jgi:hypothetical protein
VEHITRRTTEVRIWREGAYSEEDIIKILNKEQELSRPPGLKGLKITEE